jgi:hypothetical protein
MKTFAYGTFDENAGLLDVTHESGFFSVCTVTLQMLAALDRLPKNLKIRTVNQKFWWDLPENEECFSLFLPTLSRRRNNSKAVRTHTKWHLC